MLMVRVLIICSVAFFMSICIFNFVFLFFVDLYLVGVCSYKLYHNGVEVGGTKLVQSDNNVYELKQVLNGLIKVLIDVDGETTSNNNVSTTTTTTSSTSSASNNSNSGSSGSAVASTCTVRLADATSINDIIAMVAKKAGIVDVKIEELGLWSEDGNTSGGV